MADGAMSGCVESDTNSEVVPALLTPAITASARAGLAVMALRLRDAARAWPDGRDAGAKSTKREEMNGSAVRTAVCCEPRPIDCPVSPALLATCHRVCT